MTSAGSPVGSAPAGPPGSWNAANGLTAIRVVLVPLFGWLLLRDDGSDPASRVAAALVFAVAVVTDRLDGEVARRRGLVTDVGKIADPIADKVLIGTALVGLSLLGDLPWWVTAVILTREVVVTVLRLLVLRRGVIPAGRGGKAKTAIQALAIFLLVVGVEGVWHTVAVVVMAVAVVLTVVTGVDYVVQVARLWAGSHKAGRTDAGLETGR